MKKLMKKYFQEFGRVGGILMIVGLSILLVQLIYEILAMEWFMIILDALALATLLYITWYKISESK